MIFDSKGPLSGDFKQMFFFIFVKRNFFDNGQIRRFSLFCGTCGALSGGALNGTFCGAIDRVGVSIFLSKSQVDP